MKFLRRHKHPLTAAERHSLDKIIATCRLDKSGEKARFIIYTILGEAILYKDLGQFDLYFGYKALYAHFNPNDPCAKMEKRP